MGKDMYRIDPHVGEDRSDHHADEQARKIEQLGNGDAEEYGADHQQAAAVARFEEPAPEAEQRAERGADGKRKPYLAQGLENDLFRCDRSAYRKDLRQGEADGEYYEADRIVERDDGKQGLRNGALGLILPYDHKRGGGSGRSRDSAQKQRPRNVILAVAANEHHGRHDENDRRNGLREGDHDYLSAELFDRGELEFAADRERYEAERNGGDDAEAPEPLFGDQAAEGTSRDELPEIGADEKAGDQIARDVGKIEYLHNTGKREPRYHGEAHHQQR